MNDEERKIIISKVSEYRQNESGEFHRVPVSPVNRWITIAILIPVVALMVILGIFFLRLSLLYLQWLSWSLEYAFGGCAEKLKMQCNNPMI